MATLYTQAESNVRKTWLLMTGLFLFIIALGWLFGYLLDAPEILPIAVILSAAMSVGNYWYSDKLVLAITRAKPVEKMDEPELYRIVENLSIASGLPAPKVYVIEEKQPNAFATGRNANNAVIAVTRGLLEKLERNELEGVIAHEFSHIGNKDIFLSAVIVIMAGTIAFLSNCFLRMSFWGGTRRRDSRDNSGAILIFLGIVAAILAPVAASLIHMAISRKREFLADASGALLTRYPEGLAMALEKIAGDPTPMRIANEATAHLFISSPLKGEQQTSRFAKLFLTHPPAEERIKALRDMSV